MTTQGQYDPPAQERHEAEEPEQGEVDRCDAALSLQQRHLDAGDDDGVVIPDRPPARPFPNPGDAMQVEIAVQPVKADAFQFGRADAHEAEQQARPVARPFGRQHVHEPHIAIGEGRPGAVLQQQHQHRQRPLDRRGVGLAVGIADPREVRQLVEGQYPFVIAAAPADSGSRVSGDAGASSAGGFPIPLNRSSSFWLKSSTLSSLITVAPVAGVGWPAPVPHATCGEAGARGRRRRIGPEHGGRVAERLFQQGQPPLPLQVSGQHVRGIGFRQEVEGEQLAAVPLGGVADRVLVVGVEPQPLPGPRRRLT